MIIEQMCQRWGAKLMMPFADSGEEGGSPASDDGVSVFEGERPAGTVVGGFKIIRKLGTGGMGDVYLARQLSMDRNVALKILHPAVALNQEHVQAFLTEIRTAARMEHPHMVTAFEAGQADDTYFMAMSYVEGNSLHDMVRAFGALNEQRALTMGQKVGSALNYAWEKHRVMHRDVTPFNILIDQNGEPRLLDLGLALHASLKQGADGELAGTPNFISPEVVTGRHEIDFRSDIYSLGATLYEALTGQVPFGDGSRDEILREVVQGDLPDPREAAPGLSAGCVDLLEKMLARDPAYRYASWTAVMSDFECVLAGGRCKGSRLASGRSAIIRHSPAGKSAGAAKKIQIQKKPAQKKPKARKAVVVKTPGKQDAGRRPSSRGLSRPAGGGGSGVSGAGLGIMVVSALLVGALVVFALHVKNQREEERLARQAYAAHVSGLRGYLTRIEQTLDVSKPESLIKGEQMLAEFLKRLNARDAARVRGDIQIVEQAIRMNMRQARENVWRDLAERAKAMSAVDRPEDGIECLQAYDDIFAADFVEKRDRLIRQLKLAVEEKRKRLEAAEKARQERLARERAALSDRLCEWLVSGNMEAVRSAIEETRERTEDDFLSGDLVALLDQFERYMAMVEQGMNYYGPAGKIVAVHLKQGEGRVRVSSVFNGMVSGRAAAGHGKEISFRWQDLVPKEKAKVFSAQKDDMAKVVLAVALVEADLKPKAAETLADVDLRLAKALLASPVLKDNAVGAGGGDDGDDLVIILGADEE